MKGALNFSTWPLGLYPALNAMARGYGDGPLFTEQELRDAKNNAARSALPGLESFADLCKIDIPKPLPLIHGLFDRAGSMVVGGGSKTFKSWALGDLAISIVHGASWWGFGTAKGPVIYCNFELKRWNCRERFKAIAKAKGLMPSADLHIWNLRGVQIRVNDFIEQLMEQISLLDAVCVMIDPFYKLLGEKDERISSEMMPILDRLQTLYTDTGASVICAAHFSKGNQASKDPMDRISGGGAINRYPDALITLTKNNAEKVEAFSVDVITRDYPPIDPFVVCWKHPLFSPDLSIDPADLKDRSGRPKEYSKEQILEVLREHDDEFNTTELQKAVSDEKGMSRAVFYRLWEEIKKANQVFLSKFSQKWNVQVSQCRVS